MNLSRLLEVENTKTTTKNTRIEKKKKNEATTWLRLHRGQTCLSVVATTADRWNSSSYVSPTRMRLLLLTALLFASLTTGRANFEGRPSLLKQITCKLHAPAIIDPRAEKLELRCEYDLKGKELYSVIWFKNTDMLYRYLPSIEPKGVVYKDAKVSLEHSNAERLVLLGDSDYRNNMKSYEGVYTCEVSTEQPFHSVYASANVSVAIVPQRNPVLEGVAHNYQVGEQLDAVCSSAASLPAAELTLYLNDQEINRTYTEQKKNFIGEMSMTTHLSVSLRLERHHFPGGNLRLTCRAILVGVPLNREFKTEKTATLAASNQRLAQEPPRQASPSVLPHLSRIGLLLALGMLALV